MSRGWLWQFLSIFFWWKRAKLVLTLFFVCLYQSSQMFIKSLCCSRDVTRVMRLTQCHAETILPRVKNFGTPQTCNFTPLGYFWEVSLFMSLGDGFTSKSTTLITIPSWTAEAASQGLWMIHFFLHKDVFRRRNAAGWWWIALSRRIRRRKKRARRKARIWTSKAA